MKRIKDLSESEILELTQEQLEELVLIEAAHSGVKLPDSAPAVPDYPEIGKPSKTLYTCGAFNFHCDSLDILNEFIKVIVDHKDNLFTCETDWQTKATHCEKGIPTSGWANKIAPATETAYTQGEYAELKGEIKKKEEMREEYKKALDEHSAQMEEYDDICSDVMSHYYNAVRAKNRKQHLVATFLKYYKLAEQNFDIALKFFKNAYADENENMEELEALFQEEVSAKDEENGKEKV